MSGWPYVCAYGFDDLWPIRAGVDMNPNGPRERLHHLEVGLRYRGCQHGGMLVVVAASKRSPRLRAPV